MSFAVILMIDNPDDCPRILDAWNEMGIPGATILESTGMGRIIKAGLRDDFPLLPNLEDFLSVREKPHRTVISVVNSQDEVDKMAEIAEKIIGNLDDPHTGFLFVIPVLSVYGLGRSRK